MSIDDATMSLAVTGAPTVEATDSRDALLLTVAEAANRLGVSRAFAYQLVMSGQLRSVKLGRLRKVRVADLTNYVASLAVDALS